jgi:hypothetical protein
VISLKPRRRKAKSPELVLTSQFFKWLFYQHRSVHEVSFHIANEGKRSRHIAALMGIKAGIPDVCIAWPTKIHHGLYVELKIKPNKPTESQTLMMGRLTLLGYMCCVCYTLDEAMMAVEDYLKGG